MKKKLTKVLSLAILVATLVSVFAITAYAIYPLECTIYYKDENGNQLADPLLFTIDASGTNIQQNKYYSPDISGYSLKNTSDAYVTYAMLDKYFPPSHYIRHGTGTYTVYYVKNQSTTIYYKYKDGSTAAPARTVSGNPNTQFSVTSPTIAGYDPNRTSCTGYYGSASQTVYYYEKAYTVTYYANGGSGAPYGQMKKHFSKLTLSSVRPTRSGYEFLGWGVAASATTPTYQPGDVYTRNGELKLYAIWGTPATSSYTVSYNANGGSGAPSSQTKTYGVSLALSSVTPIRSGYTFLGWGTSSSSTTATYQPGGTYTDNASITLYAIWGGSGVSSTTYTVRYSANGGGSAPTPQTKTHGVPLTLSTEVLSRTDYIFLGWSESSTATSPTYYAGDTYSRDNDILLYAVWRKIEVVGPTRTSITYNYNDGTGRADVYYKINGQPAQLKSTVPVTRDGYNFIGWSEDPNATEVQYRPGLFFSQNRNIYLYAVWKRSIEVYTINYNANGGTGAPQAQYKTQNEPICLSTVIPIREGYIFLGWAKSSSATEPDYYSGEYYFNDDSVTLFAVWGAGNYDLSVSDLLITPNEVNQYDKVNISFRIDNWDDYFAYDNIPVEVFLNGTVIYSTTADMLALEFLNFSFDLNVGASVGEQTVVVRVNWGDHENETMTDNNSATATYTVKKPMETSTEVIPVNGEYIEGFEVITSFYVVNEGSSDILPSDDLSFDFLVYTMEDGVMNVIEKQTWNNVVIPANGKNLVYFKWTVPVDSAGTTYFCRGTLNSASAGIEENEDNNTTEFSVMAQSIGSSQTPNTRFEKTAPSSYSPNATSTVTRTGSATWNQWVYEDGELVLKEYGISITNEIPIVTPSSACPSAVLVGGVWKMKSGYGFTLSWNPVIVSKSGYTMPSSDAYTSAQYVYATFPEYSYSTVNGKYRTLEFADGLYQFVENENADGNERLHFIPIYVQDGNYVVSVTATHIWTPAGMISATSNSNTLSIAGTMYDDLYVG